MTDIGALSNVTTLTGDMEITYNDVLPNLGGLHISQINGYLGIENNNAMISLHGLESLNSLSSLAFTNNALLTDISSLNHPIIITSNLFIENNPSLSDCDAKAICDFVNQPNGNKFISGNGTGCSSVAEIQAQCLIVLPINFLSFDGYKNGSVNKLIWTVSHEINSKEYVLERMNKEGVFFTIATLISNQDHSIVSTYNYDDNTPLIGANLYRVKHVDFDGSVVYSSLVQIINQRDDQIKLFPNPVFNTLNVLMNTDEKRSYILTNS
ncbi:MAG: hypothetical protein IPO92_19260 [Saprospiraceae bacterium]|nr:hypothetical protein [Saprospiraceae bacterium]